MLIIYISVRVESAIVALVSIISAIVSSIVALVALWFSILSTRHTQQIAIKESSDIIFKEWWSEEIRELRKYFFLEFIPQHRAKLLGKGMKSIEKIVPEDMGRATRLCFF